MREVDLFRGLLVIWMHVPRGGYGYVCPIEAMVLKWRGARVTIEVTTATGEKVGRSVRIESLRHKEPPESHLAEHLRKASGR